MSARDTQRSRVYAAEEFVRTLFDRAAQHSSRAIDFFGAQITLPPEARFASVDSVQRYVDSVLALPAVAAQWPYTDNGGGAGTAGRHGRALRAHRRRRGDRGAGPRNAGPYANWWCCMRWLTICAVVEGRPHGPDFVATFCALAEAVMGAEAAHVLRVVYVKEGAKRVCDNRQG